MELIKQLIDFLVTDNGLSKITELITAYKNGNLNPALLLKSINPERIFEMMGAFSQNESRETCFSAYGTEPIKDIACPQILNALNEFLG